MGWIVVSTTTLHTVSNTTFSLDPSSLPFDYSTLLWIFLPSFPSIHTWQYLSIPQPLSPWIMLQRSTWTTTLLLGLRSPKHPLLGIFPWIPPILPYDPPHFRFLAHLLCLGFLSLPWIIWIPILHLKMRSLFHLQLPLPLLPPHLTPLNARIPTLRQPLETPSHPLLETPTVLTLDHPPSLP